MSAQSLGAEKVLEVSARFGRNCGPFNGATQRDLEAELKQQKEAKRKEKQKLKLGEARKQTRNL